MARRGCQARIAQAILGRGGGDLLAVKDNRPSLQDETRRYVNHPKARVHNYFETTNGDYGCIDVRRQQVSHDVVWLTTARHFPSEPRFLA